MIRFGDVVIEKPITIASGPLTDKYTKIEAAEKHGAGAVSLKLTFVNVPFQSQMRSYSLPGHVIISPTNKRLDINKGIELMKKVKDNLSIKMLANYSAIGAKLDEWKRLSEGFTKAGTDILEPNFCCPNLDTSDPKAQEKSDHGGASIGENPDVCAKIMRAIKEVSDLPVVPKIIPSDRHLLISVAKVLEEEGAAGIHIVGLPTSGLPPLDADGNPDIPLLHGIPQGSTNGSICKYTAYLYTAILAQTVNIPIMVSGGLETWKDCIDAIMWGASAPSICSAAMWYGYEVIESMNQGIEDFMKQKGYTSFDDFRGKALKYFTTPDKVTIQEGTSWVDRDKCIGCGRCTRPAHCEAITLDEEGKAKISEDDCIGCGVCRRLCPTGAIEYRLKQSA